MPELWILCLALDPLKFYPRMKFHFNSISWTWVIAFGQKKCDGTEKVWRDVRTDRRTDGRTDGQTDDGKVIPKCHLCLQQVTQKLKCFIYLDQILFELYMRIFSSEKKVYFQKHLNVLKTAIWYSDTWRSEYRKLRKCLNISYGVLSLVFQGYS